MAHRRRLLASTRLSRPALLYVHVQGVFGMYRDRSLYIYFLLAKPFQIQLILYYLSYYHNCYDLC